MNVGLTMHPLAIQGAVGTASEHQQEEEELEGKHVVEH